MVREMGLIVISQLRLKFLVPTLLSSRPTLIDNDWCKSCLFPVSLHWT